MSNFYEPMYPESIYHVIDHANGFENIYANQGNYTYFLEKYAQYFYPIAKTYAYCLMPNHFHLLVCMRSEKEQTKFWKHSMEHSRTISMSKIGGLESRKPINSQELEDLKVEIDFPKLASHQFGTMLSTYTKAFNKQQNRMGSLFIPKFKRKIISNENYLHTCLRYIHQNPIRHKFTKSLMDWKHSSIHAFLENKNSKVEKEEVLSWFSSNYKQNSKEFWTFHNQGWDVKDLDLEI